MKTIRFMEEANANRLPASRQLLYDGWLLRFNQGYSRHNNCVWPLYVGILPLGEKLTFCQAQFAARGSTCGFRLSALPGHDKIEALLAQDGYVESNPNLTMYRDGANAPDAEITLMELDDWIETIYRIHPVEDPNLSE